MTPDRTLACACGRTRLAVEGKRIASVECCCTSCREAGERLSRLRGALPVLGPHGTTPFVLYRKDRVRLLEGPEPLAAFRLRPGAKTRRVVATCCNTPVFLEFSGGHWLSLYGTLWPEETRPTLEMRTMVSDLPDPSVLPADVPNLRRQSGAFFLKLLRAWIAMGFRSPTIDIKGEIHA